jgi:hypothetical protein
MNRSFGARVTALPFSSSSVDLCELCVNSLLSSFGFISNRECAIDQHLDPSFLTFPPITFGRIPITMLSQTQVISERRTGSQRSTARGLPERCAKRRTRTLVLYPLLC